MIFIQILQCERSRIGGFLFPQRSTNGSIARLNVQKRFVGNCAQPAVHEKPTKHFCIFIHQRRS